MEQYEMNQKKPLSMQRNSNQSEKSLRYGSDKNVRQYTDIVVNPLGPKPIKFGQEVFKMFQLSPKTINAQGFNIFKNFDQLMDYNQSQNGLIIKETE